MKFDNKNTSAKTVSIFLLTLILPQTNGQLVQQKNSKDIESLTDVSLTSLQSYTGITFSTVDPSQGRISSLSPTPSYSSITSLKSAENYASPTIVNSVQKNM